MKQSYLLLPFLFLIAACEESTLNEEAVTAEVTVENKESEAFAEIESSNEMTVVQDSPEYLAKNINDLSLEDANTAYALCMTALTDYYKAIWNGIEIDLSSYIQNENLKRYTEKKIQYQMGRHQDSSDNPVESVGNQEVKWEVEFYEDEDGGFLYLHVPVEVKRQLGGRGEATEFLIRNVNGKLVIVDWYTGSKDSYDFSVRGENITVNDPNIWNNEEWVQRLEKRQTEFSGSIM